MNYLENVRLRKLAVSEWVKSQRDAGKTYREIGFRMSRSGSLVRLIALHHRRIWRDFVVQHPSRKNKILELAKGISDSSC